MKIVMTSYYTGPKGKPDLKPGDGFEFDDAEAQRILSVRGARKQTDAEVKADAEAAEKAAAEKAAAEAAKKPAQ